MCKIWKANKIFQAEVQFAALDSWLIIKECAIAQCHLKQEQNLRETAMEPLSPKRDSFPESHFFLTDIEYEVTASPVLFTSPPKQQNKSSFYPSDKSAQRSVVNSLNVPSLDANYQFPVQRHWDNVEIETAPFSPTSSTTSTTASTSSSPDLVRKNVDRSKQNVSTLKEAPGPNEIEKERKDAALLELHKRKMDEMENERQRRLKFIEWVINI